MSSIDWEEILLTIPASLECLTRSATLTDIITLNRVFVITPIAFFICSTRFATITTQIDYHTFIITRIASEKFSALHSAVQALVVVCNCCQWLFLLIFKPTSVAEIISSVFMRFATRFASATRFFHKLFDTAITNWV